MRYRITAEAGYLKAELFERRTAEETRVFLDAVAAEGVKRQLRIALMSVHASDPIFSLERYGFSAFVNLAEQISDRIALMADSPELRIAHEYAAMLARWRGINVRTFRDEAAAIKWLKARRQSPDRRRNQSSIDHPERRTSPSRRGREEQRSSG
jgi:hypothetical protein